MEVKTIQYDETWSSVTLPVGTAVWPVRFRRVKSANTGRDRLLIFAGPRRLLTRQVVVTEFSEIPNTKKFSKFLTSNAKGKKFVMGMMSKAISEKDVNDPKTLTYGFIFDARRATDLIPAR